jgi:dTDP-4-amino-4,6-dideoxygalactose transaminase
MIPFNKPYMTGRELGYIERAHASSQLSGDGDFTRRCSRWLEQRTGTPRALLTHSCTAALEIAAFLLDLVPGDEIIMPSFTFVSTANAFAIRGAVPVFVDIRSDTLNLDETLVEAAITPRTRAIVVVHYAGIAAAMDELLQIANRYSLAVIEDAAQALMSTYHGRSLGTLGAYGALSFHETKNVVCGEGGALLIRDKGRVARAEIVREKGTDRSRFMRGEIDKYTWVDVGSSYVPGEILAAFLYAQMEHADEITRRRLGIWDVYHRAFADLERREAVRRPVVPDECIHNAHIYYLLLRNRNERDRVIAELKVRGVAALFHYVPLHSSPAGRKLSRCATSMAVTDDLSGRLVRLPLWLGLEAFQQTVIEQVEACVLGRAR